MSEKNIYPIEDRQEVPIDLPGNLPALETGSNNVCNTFDEDEELIILSEESKTQLSGGQYERFAFYSMLEVLYKLYTGKITDSNLKVTKMLKMGLGSKFADRPNFFFLRGMRMYHTKDEQILVSFNFKGFDYEFLFSLDIDEAQNPVLIRHIVYKTCMSQNGEYPDSVSDYIFDLAMENSSMKNRLFLFEGKRSHEPEEIFFELFSSLKPEDIKPNDLFLPESKREEMERFIYAVKNFERDRINLRYLLNGPPGTGKTQLMKMVASQLSGYATVILARNCEQYLNKLFNFGKVFEPCLLIIDDIDLIVGNRQRGDAKNLGFFLQQLDGYLPGSLFIIATTNDKSLVDMAASRPGRFDLIIDVGELEPENYLSLVRRETEDVEILSFFDDGVLAEMKKRKVTGAFIVSLIKQFLSRKKMAGTISVEEMNTMFKMQHRGFYSTNAADMPETFGFNS